MVPGPASSVEEHSLRNIFRSQGDRSSNLAEYLSFQTRSIGNAKMFDGNFQTIGPATSITQPSDQKNL